MSARLYDKDFKYVPAAKTDIRKTFARIRRELAEQQRAQDAKVKPIQQRRKA